MDEDEPWEHSLSSNYEAQISSDWTHSVVYSAFPTVQSNALAWAESEQLSRGRYPDEACYFAPDEAVQHVHVRESRRRVRSQGLLIQVSLFSLPCRRRDSRTRCTSRLYRLGSCAGSTNMRRYFLS